MSRRHLPETRLQQKERLYTTASSLHDLLTNTLTYDECIRVVEGLIVLICGTTNTKPNQIFTDIDDVIKAHERRTSTIQN